MPNFEHFNRQKTAFRHFERNQFERGAYVFGVGGCYFDLDAAYGTDTIVNGAAITTWKDKITGNTFEQNTANNKPLYLVSDSDFNNHPSVRMIVNNQRRMTTITPVGFSNQFIFAAVFKLLTISSNHNTLCGVAQNSTGQPIHGAANTLGAGIYDAGLNRLGSPDPLTVPQIVIYTPNHVIVNGAIKASGAIGTPNGIGWIGNSVTATHPNAHYVRLLAWNNILSEDNCIALSDRINNYFNNVIY